VGSVRFERRSMNYVNFTARCPHGFALGLVRCEECEGPWCTVSRAQVEPRNGHRAHVVERRSLVARTREQVPASYRGRI
jgi:hypothetical protein